MSVESERRDRMRYPWRKTWAPMVAAAIAVAIVAIVLWNPARTTPVHPAAVFVGHRYAYRVHTPAGLAWHEQSGANAADLDLALIDDAGATIRVTATTAARSSEELFRARFPDGALRVLDRQVAMRGEDRALRVRARRPRTDDEVQLEIVQRDDVFYVIEATAPASANSAERLAGIIRDFEPPPAEVLLDMPQPPLVLRAPAVPAGAELPAGKDDVDALLAIAAQHADDDPEQAAIAYQRAHAKGALDVAYTLATLAGRRGQIDDAFYWLQRAAIEDGISIGDTRTEPALAAMRADPRWPAVLQFCQRLQRYYAHHPVEIEAVAVPKDYRAGTPIPLLIALHGLGDGPTQFFGWLQGQEAADVFHLAIASVSGTVARGPHAFAWAEDPARDLARIDRALATLRDRVTIADGKVMLLGFSQGAQLALELAARHPERFAGAIGLSPGTLTERTLDGLADGSLAQRRFVALVGAGEDPRTVATTADDAAKLRAAGASVYHRAHPEQSRHTFPPDFYDALGAWLAFVLDGTPIAP